MYNDLLSRLDMPERKQLSYDFQSQYDQGVSARLTIIRLIEKEIWEINILGAPLYFLLL